MTTRARLDRLHRIWSPDGRAVEQLATDFGLMFAWAGDDEPPADRLRAWLRRTAAHGLPAAAQEQAMVRALARLGMTAAAARAVASAGVPAALAVLALPPDQATDPRRNLAAGDRLLAEAAAR